jgi:CheY-like chemotaxis protein
VRHGASLIKEYPMNTLDPQTIAPRSLKILVVDDAPTNRQILEVFLGRLGHSIVTANDGEQAVAAFEAEQPDLILMDVMMPRMDGYEAAAKIKSMSKERWVPLVFLSALTTDEQMVTGLESGGDDYLTKPINFVMLKAKIRSLARTLDMQHKLDTARKQMASISENINDAVVTADVAGIIRWGQPVRPGGIRLYAGRVGGPGRQPADAAGRGGGACLPHGALLQWRRAARGGCRAAGNGGQAQVR